MTNQKDLNFTQSNNDFDIDQDLPDMDISNNNISIKEKKILDKKIKEKKELDSLSKLKNIDIEKSILYLLITSYSDNVIETITGNNIKNEWFLSSIGNKIFTIIFDLATNGKVDILFVKEHFEKLAKDDKEKAQFNIFFNFNGFLPKKNFLIDYIDLLMANFQRNGLNNLLLHLEKAIINKDDDKIKYLKAEIEQFELKSRGDDNPDVGLVSNKYLAKQATEWINGAWKTSNTICKTGFSMIDDKIGGFEKGNMIVFAARPSVGKSIALVNTMHSMTKQGYTCLYVSAEMYAKYIYSRWMSIELEINNEKIKAPFKLSNSEKKKVLAFQEVFKNNKNAHFHFDNVITAREIELVARRVKAQNNGKLDAIFVDYLGKLYPNNMDMKRSRNDIVTDISSELFGLASKLDIVMVTATQLNRASAGDAEQESLVVPEMKDIRDSGSVAQDADIIIGLSRDKAAGNECFTEEEKTDFMWTFVKNRNGALGKYVFDFHPTIQKIVDRVTAFNDNLLKNPSELAEKNNSKKEENIIKELLKEEEGDNFTNGTNDIF